VISALASRFGPWILAGVLGLLALHQHDQLVTWRLKDKDQQAVEFNLHRDVADRDRRIGDRAIGEAADRGEADRSCATEISSSFQKGVAVGRVMTHAKSSSPAAPGPQPGPGGLLDYREVWEASAFKPTASGSPAGGGVRAPGG
jgi:hypothetical protein